MQFIEMPLKIIGWLTLVIAVVFLAASFFRFFQNCLVIFNWDFADF
jgi:hypothetical protein